ncbi:SDR family oxidoreductase [Halorhabdus salina]|uniref:SDR family oxidoreductase n=1 Tax=Halorhabdus salina TaxID=2750670 RepID=UPI0015EEBB6A|nr:SDR family oxidoreductase [Halorhabdus salina]
MDSDDNRVLVTGATGTVGSRVVGALADWAGTVRAATRDPDETSVSAADETVAFDFERPETWGPAFEGVDRLFLVRPPAISRVGESILPAIDAAGRVGVEHVVVLSVLGAENIPLLPHRRIEKHLQGSSLDWTFLRASFFMENLVETHGQEIVERGELVVPAGDGATSFVAADDVAAVGTRVLTASGHRNRAYDLTGPAALTYHEVAATLGTVLDHDVQYTEPSLLEFVRHSRIGRPWGLTVVMVGLYTTARLGLAERVSVDAERVLGRPPTALAPWAGANRDAFEATGARVS